MTALPFRRSAVLPSSRRASADLATHIRQSVFDFLDLTHHVKCFETTKHMAVFCGGESYFSVRCSALQRSINRGAVVCRGSAVGVRMCPCGVCLGLKFGGTAIGKKDG